MMRKFDVGDKVRVIRCELAGDELRHYVGMDGTVVDIFTIDRSLYTVEFGDENRIDAWGEELELLVEPATSKFAVGDRVKCVANICGPIGDRYVDCEGVVRDVLGNTAFPYVVRLDDGGDCDCSPTELELVKPANDDAAVIRGTFAKVAGLTFLNENGEVLVFDEDGDGIAAMTLAQFNEVHRIINEVPHSSEADFREGNA